jgi:hypothetical protein
VPTARAELCKYDMKIATFPASFHPFGCVLIALDFTIKLSVLFAVVAIFMRNSRRPELVDLRYCGAARRDRLPRWVSLDFVTFCLRTKYENNIRLQDLIVHSIPGHGHIGDLKIRHSPKATLM